MVGRAMAIDLSKKHQVTSIDIDKDALDLLPDKPTIRTSILDVTDKSLLALAVKDDDLVISAVP